MAIQSEQETDVDEVQGAVLKARLQGVIVGMDADPRALALALEGLLIDVCIEEFTKGDDDAAWAMRLMGEAAYNFFKAKRELIGAHAMLQVPETRA